MTNIHYDLEPGEFVLLFNSSVQKDNRGSYGNELILTNKNVVFVELGLFGGVKQVVVYPLDIISQACVGIAKNGDKQLQIIYGSDTDDFDFGHDDKRNRKLWAMAINDQLSEFSDYFDASYYERFSEESLKKTSRQIAQGEVSEKDVSFDIGDLGEAAFSLLKSGNFSTKALQRTLMRNSRKGNSSGGILKGLKDELGITDIQNEFLDMFGMETEETNSEREERFLDAAFEYEVYQARMEIASMKEQELRARAHAQESNSSAARSVDEQIEAVKKLKELLDAGILTQEEFDQKKKEVMNL